MVINKKGHDNMRHGKSENDDENACFIYLRWVVFCFVFVFVFVWFECERRRMNK